VLLYYITDRTQFPGDEHTRQGALLEKIAEATRCGVDLIQLREKDLPIRDLEVLTHAALRIVRPPGIEGRKLTTRLLLNSRTDVAVACGADGVHLRSDDISPLEVQKIWAQAGNSSRVLVSVSCHSARAVAHAASEGADFAVLAPIFEKKDAPEASPASLSGLAKACRHKIPVVALGGITLKNARACRDAGAAGVAAIRLFQENHIADVVRGLEV